jgi:hypothetical protein
MREHLRSRRTHWIEVLRARGHVTTNHAGIDNRELAQDRNELTDDLADMRSHRATFGTFLVLANALPADTSPRVFTPIVTASSCIVATEAQLGARQRMQTHGTHR